MMNSWTLPTHQQNVGVRVAQRIWKSGTNYLQSPTVPLLQYALWLQRQQQQKDEQSVVTISDLKAQDFSTLFSAATKLSSSPKLCYTFVLSDWEVFGGNHHHHNITTKQSSSPTPTPAPTTPILNLVRRSPGDFAYNNHIYDAIRNSFKWDEVVIAAMTTRNEKEEEACCGDLADDLTLSSVKCDEDHKNCAALPLALSKVTKNTETFLQECNNVNNISSSRRSSEEDQHIFFFPFKNNRKNVAFENKHFFVIVNLKPVEKAGHLLVIPKKIRGTLFETFFDSTTVSEEKNKEIISDFGDAIKMSIDALNRRMMDRKGKPCDGFSVVTQQGVCAGQTVAHVHTHVIALTRGEGLCSMENQIKSIDPDADKRSAEELEEEEREMRKPRGEKEMIEEAQDLKENYFN